MRALAIAALAACAASSPPALTTTTTTQPADAPAPAAAALSRPFEVSIHVTRRRGGAIRPGDVLVTNEDFEIGLELAEAAHVYIGGLDTGGGASQLIPGADRDAQLAAGTHRLPTKPSSWLFLRPPAGSETLFVIASRRPISDVDRSLATIVGELPPGQDVVRPPERAPGARPPKVGVGLPKAAPGPPRRDPNWRPDPARITGLTPRGTLRPREIGLRDDGPHMVTAADGLVVYLLQFSHRGGS